MNNNHQLENQLAELGLDIGFNIRNKITMTPTNVLCSTGTSRFKGQGAKNADIIGEELTIEKLQAYATNSPHQFIVILDPVKKEFLNIEKDKPYSSDKKIWVYSDAVDGTIKLAGLGNAISAEKAIYRVGNDGVWGAGTAFTRPTTKSFDELDIKDFEISAVVDGNPARWPTAPINAYTHFEGETIQTYERLENGMN